MNITRIINGVLWRLEKFFSRTRLRLLKTAYINFRVLPMKVAIRFPIHIYGRVKLYCLAGKIEIRGPITKGMIKLGYQQGAFSAPRGGALILLEPGTKLIFNGPCMFDFDYAIRITGRGTVNLGAYIGFGNDIKIYCEESITIGDYCRIAFGSSFIDTNYHYSIELSSGTVRRKSASIEVGRYNWIGNTSTFMKGAKTPEGAIVASKSFLNKDYTKLENGEKCVVLAGSPAKIVQHNCTRVTSLDAEMKINNWFNANPDQNEYCDPSILSEYHNMHQYHKLFK